MTKKRSLTREDAQEAVRIANIVYFRSSVHEHTTWMGVKAMKCTGDMWIYQELIHSLNVDLIVETSTLEGGSVLFFAHMLDINGKGEVLTIDLKLQENLPQHPRIRYIEGSSINHHVLKGVKTACDQANSVLVILDADHTAEYKLKELRAYAGFVRPGGYIIAEDSTFDYFPSYPEFDPGPATAVRDFLAENPDFEADRSQERHQLTFAPMASLRRRSD